DQRQRPQDGAAAGRQRGHRGDQLRRAPAAPGDRRALLRPAGAAAPAGGKARAGHRAGPGVRAEHGAAGQGRGGGPGGGGGGGGLGRRRGATGAPSARRPHPSTSRGPGKSMPAGTGCPGRNTPPATARTSAAGPSAVIATPTRDRMPGSFAWDKSSARSEASSAASSNSSTSGNSKTRASGCGNPFETPGGGAEEDTVDFALPEIGEGVYEAELI